MARLTSITGERRNGWPETAARIAVRGYWAGARVFSLVLFLAAWELLARSGMFTHFQLPALSDVLQRIWSDGAAGDLWINTGLTLYRALTSFCICTVLGVLTGMAMSRNVIANWFFDPIVSAVRSTSTSRPSDEPHAA